MKYIAVDIGEKRIGLAVSDESGIIARPLFSIETNNSIFAKFGAVIREEKPDLVIFGLPRHESGEESKAASQIREFAKGIHFEFGVDIDFEDESGTSLEAEKRLKQRGLSVEEIKKEVDAEAAAVILESYLRRS